MEKSIAILFGENMITILYIIEMVISLMVESKPGKSILIKLINLTFLDLEKLMADDVRPYIGKARKSDTDLEEIMK
ncbi:hypothetical protein [Rahnella laticis]|uniref:hypothetical protein n=1 Tax=Rahnella laticis TaxID=2787622 RepID=UPI0018A2AF43|nr:hypothetical protein [Rahnella laticis]MBF7992907.1 hypothetical protein [Rahnella laticis]